MRIIISPAKQMVELDDAIESAGQPIYLSQAEEILDYMLGLDYAAVKKLWGCSERLAQENYARLHELDPGHPPAPASQDSPYARVDLAHDALSRASTPAILAFDGIAFKYMAPSVFEDGQFEYVQQHLRILSGFYGVLRPLDAVVSYRLEMQAKAQVAGSRNLYDYWGSTLYDAVRDDSHIIINLASKEYSTCIERHLTPDDTMVTCVFGELATSARAPKVVQKGVYAKMARGEMVRYMAEHDIEDPRDMQAFDRLGYTFCPERSDDKTYVFLK